MRLRVSEAQRSLGPNRFNREGSKNFLSAKITMTVITKEPTVFDNEVSNCVTDVAKMTANPELTIAGSEGDQDTKRKQRPPRKPRTNITTIVPGTPKSM